ncbi:organelle RRM domain-containing protein 1, chloroplastic [Andrographis paniculata]|uniref:organelle RRM domain-containing protein 1, chloroplastic n=1 Tax=Andrographis paniculata TaxID=175694 RepID=UPI0021E927EA|nr:organelle RRM domain-containing protein 1, chloroplastic [Andrographis paniculata]
MALFSLPCKSPNLCPNFPRKNHAIQMPISSNCLISNACKGEISRFTMSGTTINPFIRKAECRSSLDSSGASEGEGAPPNVVIFVKGLAQSTSEGALKEAFSQFGEVCRVKIISDKKTQQSLGFAYVWFTREEHARAVVDKMNGNFFEGRFIRVEIAKPGSCKPRPRPRPYKF